MDTFLMVYLLLSGVAIGALLGAWATVEALRAGDRIVTPSGDVLTLTPSAAAALVDLEVAS